MNKLSPLTGHFRMAGGLPSLQARHLSGWYEVGGGGSLSPPPQCGTYTHTDTHVHVCYWHLFEVYRSVWVPACDKIIARICTVQRGVTSMHREGIWREYCICSVADKWVGG